MKKPRNRRLHQRSSERRQSLADRYRMSEGIWVPKAGAKDFGYSDGSEVESRILDAVTSAADRSVFSDELRHAITDWPSLYHFSAARANLLRPFAQKLAKSDILEVGAGCGAITRFLGEIGASVVAVEGSLQRARTIQKRTSGQKSVSVVCDKIQDFSSDRKFDVILLIGVLEYARIYVENDVDGQIKLLNHLGSLLRRDGIIIVAIENQLGLKYFAGASEDHLGRAFSGINDEYECNSPATFGHQVLARILRKAEFDEQLWYYPFPDYKLPTSVISTEALNGPVGANLVASTPMADAQRPSDPLFSLEAAWQVAAQNGLLDHLANSFLVVAGKTPSSLRHLTAEHAIAWHYSLARHPHFAKEAQFIAKPGAKSVFVRRSRLVSVAAPKVPIFCNISDEPYIDGANWWFELVRTTNAVGWTPLGIAKWCRPWIDAVRAEMKFAPATFEIDFKKKIDGKYIDAVPFNLIRDSSGRYHFIDQEWRLAEKFEFKLLAFRGIRDSLLRLSSVARPGPNTPINVNQLTRAVLALIGIVLTSDELHRFAEIERKLQNWVYGKDNKTIGAKLPHLAGEQTQTLTVRGGEQDLLRAELIRVGNELVSAQRQIVDLEQTVQAKSGELQAVRVEAAAAGVVGDNLIRERDAFLAERETFLADLDRHKQALAEARADLDRHKQALADARADLNRHKRAFAEVRADREKHKQALADAVADGERYKQALAGVRSDLDRHMLALAEMRSDRDRYKQALVELRADLDRHKQALAEAGADGERYKQALADVRADLDRHKQALAEAGADGERYKQALADVRADLDRHKQALAEAGADGERYKQALADVRADLDRHKQALAEAGADGERYKQALADVRADLDRHKQALAEAGADGERYKQALADVRADLDRHKQALAEAGADGERHKQALADVRADLDRHKQALAEAGADGERYKQALAECVPIWKGKAGARGSGDMSYRLVLRICCFRVVGICMTIPGVPVRTPWK